MAITRSGRDTPPPPPPTGGLVSMVSEPPPFPQLPYLNSTHPPPTSNINSCAAASVGFSPQSINHPSVQNPSYCPPRSSTSTITSSPPSQKSKPYKWIPEPLTLSQNPQIQHQSPSHPRQQLPPTANDLPPHPQPHQNPPSKPSFLPSPISGTPNHSNLNPCFAPSYSFNNTGYDSRSKTPSIGSPLPFLFPSNCSAKCPNETPSLGLSLSPASSNSIASPPQPSLITHPHRSKEWVDQYLKSLQEKAMRQPPPPYYIEYCQAKAIRYPTPLQYNEYLQEKAMNSSKPPDVRGKSWEKSIEEEENRALQLNMDVNMSESLQVGEIVEVSIHVNDDLELSNIDGKEHEVLPSSTSDDAGMNCNSDSSSEEEDRGVEIKGHLDLRSDEEDASTQANALVVDDKLKNDKSQEEAFALGSFEERTPLRSVQLLMPSTQPEPSQLPVLHDQLKFGTDMAIDSMGVESEVAEVSVDVVISEEVQKDDPLNSFLPYPLTTKCSDELQEKINRFIAYKKVGKSFNADLRNRKDCRNPDFLQPAVRYHDMDQIGTCLSKDDFDPHGYDRSDYFNEDKSLRELAGKAFSIVATYDLDYLVGDVLDKLVPCTLSLDLRMRHGATIGAGIVSAIEKARLYRGKGGELMRSAVSRFLECLSPSEVTLSETNKKCLLDTLNKNLKHPNAQIQCAVVEALKHFAKVYIVPLGDRIAGNVTVRYLEFLDDPIVTASLLDQEDGNVSAWSWCKTIALLEDNGFKVTAIDLVGSGIDSFDTNNITSLAQNVQQLTSFLEKLGNEEKVILVGHDFGGASVFFAMDVFPSHDEVNDKEASEERVGHLRYAIEARPFNFDPGGGKEYTGKIYWNLSRFGDVLVFASKKSTIDEIKAQLIQRNFKVATLHGDKDQASRMEICNVAPVVSFAIAKPFAISFGSAATLLSAHLTGIHSAIKMLNSRTIVLHQYLLTMGKGEIALGHSLLRQISSLMRRLLAMKSEKFQDAVILREKVYRNAIHKPTNLKQLLELKELLAAEKQNSVTLSEDCLINSFKSISSKPDTESVACEENVADCSNPLTPLQVKAKGQQVHDLIVRVGRFNGTILYSSPLYHVICNFAIETYSMIFSGVTFRNLILSRPATKYVNGKHCEDLEFVQLNRVYGRFLNFQKNLEAPFLRGKD